VIYSSKMSGCPWAAWHYCTPHRHCCENLKSSTPKLHHPGKAEFQHSGTTGFELCANCSLAVRLLLTPSGVGEEIPVWANNNDKEEWPSSALITRIGRAGSPSANCGSLFISYDIFSSIMQLIIVSFSLLPTCFGRTRPSSGVSNSLKLLHCMVCPTSHMTCECDIP
jgi:hypothetical protein